jgi:hypothetical protein
MGSFCLNQKGPGNCFRNGEVTFPLGSISMGRDGSIPKGIFHQNHNFVCTLTAIEPDNVSFTPILQRWNRFYPLGPT